MEPIASRIELALIYGSVAKGTETAASDVDLLVVADGVTLEELYRELATAENALDRKIHPTLYTSKEFSKRRRARNPFLTKVLEGNKIVLLGDSDDSSATR